uniref:Uncharacterized protein n=1 Tax=Anguilla anguilla TaxID=7936 RepID=A0A0E9QQH6_ANGAN
MFTLEKLQSAVNPNSYTGNCSPAAPTCWRCATDHSITPERTSGMRQECAP